MTEEQKSGNEILEELEALGQQLATAVKSLWESEDSRRLRQQIGEGFLELGQQIDTAIQSAQESETAKQFSEQVKETMEKARESDITTKVEQGLVSGLRQLNVQIEKLVESLQTPKATEEEPEGGTEA
jgi:NAD dependent epimerase/dehydratase family enzyme